MASPQLAPPERLDVSRADKQHIFVEQHDDEGGVVALDSGTVYSRSVIERMNGVSDAAVSFGISWAFTIRNRRSKTVVEIGVFLLVLKCALPKHVGFRERLVAVQDSRVAECRPEVGQIFKMILIWMADDQVIDIGYGIGAPDMFTRREFRCSAQVDPMVGTVRVFDPDGHPVSYVPESEHELAIGHSNSWLESVVGGRTDVAAYVE